MNLAHHSYKISIAFHEHLFVSTQTSSLLYSSFYIDNYILLSFLPLSIGWNI